MAEDEVSMMTNADRLIAAGDLASARERYERIVEACPRSADAWFNLGWLYRRERRFYASIAAYGRAIDGGLDRAEEAMLNRAATLSEDLHDPDSAEREILAALEYAPARSEAWIALGNLREDLGRADEAIAAYTRAAELSPTNGRAQARLAALDVFNGDPSAAVARLKTRLALDLGMEDRRDMLFALGAALDRLGAYDDAIQAIEAANILAAAARPRYSRLNMEASIDRTIEAFPAREPSADNIGNGLIFIVGLFRSGSTLIEQCLSRHSCIHAAGELDLIPALVASGEPDTISLEKIRRSLLARYQALAPSSPFVIDKRCDNLRYVGLIKRIFPGALIIHTERQPLGVLLSQYFLDFGDAIDYATSLGDAAHHYVQQRRLMDHWQRLFPDVIRVSYEDFVQDPRTGVADLLTALGLPSEEACGRPDLATRTVKTASSWEVRQPVHIRSVGRWRNYERHLADTRLYLDAHGISIN